MDLPLAARLALGDARLALVEQLERMIHRLADLASGRAADAIARVEGGIDGRFEGRQGHRISLAENDVRALSGFGGRESRSDACPDAAQGAASQAAWRRTNAGVWYGPALRPASSMPPRVR